MEKWEVEEAARTLMRAEEIRSNRRLASAVKRELVKQQRAVNKAIKKVK